MDEMLKMQKRSQQHLQQICEEKLPGLDEQSCTATIDEHRSFQTKVFPLLDKCEKSFVLVDNFRYDQWIIIRELLSEFYTFTEEETYCSILPTATQYARNAIFSTDATAIQQMYPHLWIEEKMKREKNINEGTATDTTDRFRKKYNFSYHKVFESGYCEK